MRKCSEGSGGGSRISSGIGRALGGSLRPTAGAQLSTQLRDGLDVGCQLERLAAYARGDRSAIERHRPERQQLQALAAEHGGRERLRRKPERDGIEDVYQ